MNEAQTVQTFPRGALIGAAALIGLAMASAATARIVGMKQPRPTAAVLAARDLLFEDRQDGSIEVRNAADGSTISVLAPGSNGFIRASLRSLAKRRRFDGDTSQTFRLTAWADGRLTLDDPATGRPIELEAFGVTNELAFARLLGDGSKTP